MNCHKPTDVIKVPFRACHNAVIRHKSMTIQLNIEWPERNGDNPNLVMHIIDGTVSPISNPNETGVLRLPDNESLLSSMPHLLPAEVSHPTDRYPQVYTSFSSSNPTMNVSGAPASHPSDHNDVSSTTSTNTVIVTPGLTGSVKRNSSLPNDFDPHAFPMGTQQQQQPMPNQSYSSPQEIMQLPSNTMDDPQTNASIPPTSPSSFITRSISDSQSTPIAPTNGHQHHCPALRFNEESPNSGSPLEIPQRTPSNPSAPQTFVFVNAPTSYHSKPSSPPKRQEQTLFRIPTPAFTPTQPLVLPPPGPSFNGVGLSHAAIQYAHAHSHPRFPGSNMMNSNAPQTSFDLSLFNPQDLFCEQPSRPLESPKTRPNVVKLRPGRPRKKHPTKQESPAMASKVDPSTPLHPNDSSAVQQHTMSTVSSHASPPAQKPTFPRLLASPVHSPPNMQTNQQQSPPSHPPTNKVTASGFSPTPSNHTGTHSAPPTPLLSTESASPAKDASSIDRTIDVVARGNDSKLTTNPSATSPVFLQQAPMLLFHGSNAPIPNGAHVSTLHGRSPAHPHQARFVYPDQRPTMYHPQPFNSPGTKRPILFNPNGPPLAIKTAKRPYRRKHMPNKVAKTGHHETCNAPPYSTANQSSTQRTLFQSFVQSTATAAPSLLPTRSAMMANASHPTLYRNEEAWQLAHIEGSINAFPAFNPSIVDNQTEATAVNMSYMFDFEENFNCPPNRHFDASTPPPPPGQTSAQLQALFIDDLMRSSSASMVKMSTSSGDFFEDFLPSMLATTSQENQVTSSVSTPPESQNTQASHLPTVPSSSPYCSQQNPLPDFHSLAQVRLPPYVQS